MQSCHAVPICSGALSVTAAVLRCAAHMKVLWLSRRPMVTFAHHVAAGQNDAGQGLTQGTQALVDVLGLLKAVSCGFTLAHTLTACMTTAAHPVSDTCSHTS